MGINIYELVKKFTSCKNITEGYNEQNENTYQTECNESNEIFSDISKFNDEKICHKSMYYLNEIQGNYPGKEDAGCIYLYYWLYDHCKEECESAEIIDIYNKLINKYEDQNGTVCTEYKKNNISKYEFDKLKDIYDLNEKLIKIGTNSDQEYCSKFKSIYVKRKDECDYNAQSGFCSVLEEYRNKYHEKVATLRSNTFEYQILPPFKRYNIIAYIYVPLFLILIMVFLLFAVYKFTKFGSFLHRKIIRNKNIQRSIDEGINAHCYSLISNKISRKSKCNILYNYDNC
ncbi:variable surface protein [Plasmodium gonderi]|uniref:Variable surface protein n=1 Tax=Plasmodium gonderi TaxID=77519 RepID=A0A1Y1JPS8_PLAGO|nr:variable surface protein [Plasmodium gonderi]GAW84626.1 variable surface protein [Plasmodium gonderi]